jgi:hypothetical protein
MPAARKASRSVLEASMRGLGDLTKAHDYTLCSVGLIKDEWDVCGGARHHARLTEIFRQSRAVIPHIDLDQSLVSLTHRKPPLASDSGIVGRSIGRARIHANQKTVACGKFITEPTTQALAVLTSFREQSIPIQTGREGGLDLSAMIVSGLGDCAMIRGHTDLES